VTPLLARAYPNGQADVNQFRDAGGVPFLVRELLAEGLLHADARTVWGEGVAGQGRVPDLGPDGALRFVEPPAISGDETVVRPIERPFQPTGGI
jgi:phosphogluconate dehydratase